MTWVGLPNFCPDNSDCPDYGEHCKGTDKGDWCLKLNDYSNRSGFCKAGVNGAECLVGIWRWSKNCEYVGGAREAEVHLYKHGVIKKFNYCPQCGRQVKRWEYCEE
jgi:hypothetical protein